MLQGPEPPPTPTSASIPRVNLSSNAFVPRKHAAPVSAAKPPGYVYREGSPGTPNRRPTSVHIESEDRCKARLADEEKDHLIKVAADERVRKEKVEGDQEVTEAEEKKHVWEESEKEEIRKGEEAKVHAEEERRVKEAEELKVGMLPPLDAISLEPTDQQHHMGHGESM